MAHQKQLNLPQLLHHEEKLKAAHLANMESVHSQKVAIVRKRKYTCLHCGNTGQLSTWGFVQVYTYTPPTGCTGGDYWTPSDTDVCHLVCPKCVKMVYIYNHPEKESLLHLISSIGVEKKEIFHMMWDKHDDDVKQIHPKEEVQGSLL